MRSDASQVLELFRAVEAESPGLGLPQSTDELIEAYLPWLEREWRQGIVALDAEQAIAFVAVGPEYEDDGVCALDLYAAFRPGWDTPALASALAEAVWQALQAFEAQHPSIEPALQPSNGGWQVLESALGRALELEGSDADEPDEAEDDEG